MNYALAPSRRAGSAILSLYFKPLLNIATRQCSGEGTMLRRNLYPLASERPAEGTPNGPAA
jgi:hypothetical protein